MKKSALEAFFKIGGKIFPSEIEKLSKNADAELKFLIKKYQKICNGPGGIWTLDLTHAKGVSYQSRRPAHKKTHNLNPFRISNYKIMIIFSRILL